MRIECKKTELGTILELASHASAKHHSLAILQCALFTATDTLEIRATNLEMGVIATLDVSVKKEGKIAVPIQPLLQTISLLSHENITLSLDGGALVVESGSSKTKIKTFPPEDFPTINTVSGAGQQVDGGSFALGLKTAVFAASQSAVKPELGSVSVHQKQPHALTFVSTDSFRLAEKTVSFKNLTLDHTLLIPHKNALDLARAIDVIGENPKMTYSASQLSLVFPRGVQVISRLIEGNFPDYEQIIPKEYQSFATVLVGDLIHTLRKTNIFTNRFLQVGLELDVKKGKLILRSENTETGATEESISGTLQGEALSLSFNQQYLSEALPHIPDESAILSFAGIGRPLVIKGANDKTFRYLVMPMNK